MITSWLAMLMYSHTSITVLWCGTFVEKAIIERIHERAIRFITDDHTSDYVELLLNTNEFTVYLERVRIIAQEVFKPKIN